MINLLVPLAKVGGRKLKRKCFMALSEDLRLLDVNPFTPSFILPTLRSMKNFASKLIRMKDDKTTNSNYLTYTFF